MILTKPVALHGGFNIDQGDKLLMAFDMSVML